MHSICINKAVLAAAVMLAAMILAPQSSAHSLHGTGPYYSYDKEGNIVAAEKDELHHHAGNSIERYFLGKVINRLGEKALSGTLILVAIAFVLGVVHTLAPGHGKAVIASYLAGNNVKVRDAVVLGVTTAVTHVLDVFVVAIIFMFVLKSTSIANFSRLLAVASACLIAAFGGYGLNDAWKEFRHSRSHQKKDADGHSHHHDHGHHHHHHSHEHPQKKGRPFLLGILLGLAPCPMAWIIFLVALSLNRAAMGIVMMISFSSAIILTTLALTVVLLKFKNKMTSQRNLPALLPVLSYVAMVCFGIMIALGSLG